MGRGEGMGRGRGGKGSDQAPKYLGLGPPVNTDQPRSQASQRTPSTACELSAHALQANIRSVGGHMRSTKGKRVKLAHTRLPSVGFWSWSRFLAVSLQVT